MDISAFIRELLFSHDCVIVPGFGGFIGNNTPARIDKSTSTFYPPVKQISFNRNLNHNDGLLAGKISESAKLSYVDARSLVEEFVSSVRKKLESGERVLFDKIGTFTNNQEGNVQFEPDNNVNYYLHSFGLESFQFPPLEGYDVRKRIVRHSEKDPVHNMPMRKVLWRAAVIIPLLAAMFSVPLKTYLFKSKVETTSLNPLVTAEFENNKIAVDENTALQAAEQKEVLVQTEQAVPEVILPVAEAEDVYLLITGSFKSLENAEKHVNVLEENGFTPEIIDGPNGFYRVCAMKSKDLQSAQGRRDSISKKFPSSWVKKN